MSKFIITIEVQDSIDNQFAANLLEHKIIDKLKDGAYGGHFDDALGKRVKWKTKRTN